MNRFSSINGLASVLAAASALMLSQRAQEPQSGPAEPDIDLTPEPVRPVVDQAAIRRSVRVILAALGQDPDDPAIRETPDRVARMYAEMLAGYGMSDDVLDKTFETETESGIVLVRDIPFVSFCEHHMLPFAGKAYVAYIPSGNKVVGLSKLARIVDVYAKRLQLQERLAQQIADAIHRKLSPAGVGVVIASEHSCMTLRGVRKPGADMVSSVMLGVFREDPAARAELLNLIKV